MPAHVEKPWKILSRCFRFWSFPLGVVVSRNEDLDENGGGEKGEHASSFPFVGEVKIVLPWRNDPIQCSLLFSGSHCIVKSFRMFPFHLTANHCRVFVVDRVALGQSSPAIKTAPTKITLITKWDVMDLIQGILLNPDYRRNVKSLLNHFFPCVRTRNVNSFEEKRTKWSEHSAGKMFFQ